MKPHIGNRTTGSPADEGRRAPNPNVLSVKSLEADRTFDAPNVDFERFVADNRLFHVRFASGLMGDPDRGQDALQSAYCRAFTHLAELIDKTKLAPWFNQILVNECRQMFRRSRWEETGLLPELENKLVGSAVRDSHGSAGETRMQRRQMASLLEAEIERIGPVFREAIVLRDLCEVPYPVVAARLGISVQALKSRLQRARAELRRRLNRRLNRGLSGARTHRAGSMTNSAHG
jgi:RNA polymerase sigma-70 factor (ECF subfamily)